VILRHLGRGHGRSPDHRPHGGCSAFVGGGSPTNSGEAASSMELERLVAVSGPRPPQQGLRHGTAQTIDVSAMHSDGPSIWKTPTWGSPTGARVRIPDSRRCRIRGHEVLVCGPPHAARCRAVSPVTGALRATSPRIRRMRGEESAPPMSQAGQFTACDRQERPVVRVACQLVEHVEPVPHSLPEDLTQHLVHLLNSTFHRPSRISEGNLAARSGWAPAQTRQRARPD
jgi:hypothetical protein